MRAREGEREGEGERERERERERGRERELCLQHRMYTTKRFYSWSLLEF